MQRQGYGEGLDLSQVEASLCGHVWVEGING